MAVILRGIQLRQLLERLRELPRSTVVADQLWTTIDTKLNQHDFIVDRWPDFKAVLLRPDTTNPRIQFLHTTMQMYAEEPKNLKNLLGNKELINWSKNIKFPALDSRLEPVVCDVAKEHGQSVIRYMCCCLIGGNRSVLKLQPVPEHLTLSSLHPDHCHLVNSHWPLRGEGSAAYIRFLIETLPSCCLYNRDGDILAYALSYHHGCTGMLHVMKEHREKGYAKIISSHLAKLLFEKSEYVYGYVEKINPASVKVNKGIGGKETEDLELVWLNSERKRERRAKRAP